MFGSPPFDLRLAGLWPPVPVANPKPGGFLSFDFRHGGLFISSEISTVWLLHLVWDQDIGGSNPSSPTNPTNPTKGFVAQLDRAAVS